MRAIGTPLRSLRSEARTCLGRVEWTSDNRESLTAWQVRSLRNQFNLSDGHARDALHEAERSTLSQAGETINRPYAAVSQEAEERRFVESFMLCAAEPLEQVQALQTLFQYSASVGISLAGTALRSRSVTSIGVLHPSFDNIPILLRRQGLHVQAVSEPRAGQPLDIPRDVEALFLTIPNNPTGWKPTADVLLRAAEECSSRHLAVVVDLTFRFQEPLGYSIYELLCGVEGLEFVVIEDTGKTWPLNDVKCSFLCMRSGELEDELIEATEEVLLNVSPALIETVRRVIECSLPGSGGQPTPLLDRRTLASKNRRFLVEVLARHGVSVANDQKGFVSWIPLPSGWDPIALAAHAESLGVSVLPGNQFLWARQNPAPYLRVALLREAVYFADGAELLGEAIGSFVGQGS